MGTRPTSAGVKLAKALAAAIAAWSMLLDASLAFNSIPNFTLQWPVPAVGRSAVSRDYATYVYSQTLGRMAYHGGLDISAPQGTAVYAAAAGTVVKIQGLGTGTGGDHGFGYTVIVQHSTPVGARYTQYSHLYEIDASIRAACGEFTSTVKRRTCSVPVSTSTRIGAVGHSAGGLLEDPSFGAHLHFELKTYPYITSSATSDDDWYFAYTPNHPDGHGYYDPILALHGAVNLASPVAVTVVTGSTEGLRLRVGPGGASGSTYRAVTSLQNGQVFDAVASSGPTTTPACSGGWYQLRKTDGSLFADSWETGTSLPEGWACRDFLVSSASSLPSLSTGLTLSLGPYVTGHQVTGTFTLTNRSSQTVVLDEVLIGGRLNGAVQDFPKAYSVAVAGNGGTYTYSGGYTFTQSGTYQFFPAYKIAGAWKTGLYHEIPVDSGAVDLREVTVAQLQPTRIIGLSGDLAFGTIQVGTTSTRTLTITNTGNSPLFVSGIDYPPGFAGSWSGTIPPGGSQVLLVTFAPVAVQSYAGAVTVRGDQTGGTNVISASGAGATSVAGRPDFNGDGAADLVWRNLATGGGRIWYLRGADLVGDAELPAEQDLNWRIVGTDDFDGDGQADLLWRHASLGTNVVWRMNGATRLGTTALPTVADPQWHVVASGDFDRDGDADVLWRHARTGQLSLWWLNRTALAGSASVARVDDLAWQVAGTADFNQDGRLDLVWRHEATGRNAVWFLDGGTVLAGGGATLPTVSDTAWRLGQVADFNRDGHPDLWWRHTITGANAVWYLSGITVVATASAPSMADTAWHLGAVRHPAPGDVNSDGRPEIVWRNYATGANLLWYLSGVTRTGARALPAVADLNWELVSVADLNRDGQQDLLWRHAGNGANAVWYCRDGSPVGTGGLPSVADRNWRVVASADFNGDTRPDLLWRHSTSGENAVWFLRDNSLTGTASITAVSDPQWQIVAAADFNGDTKPDILWRHATQGLNAVWFLDGTRAVGTASVEAVSDQAWRIAMVADFNGDGHPDLLWRHAGTGANQVWYMTGTAHVGTASLESLPDVNWRVAGR